MIERSGFHKPSYIIGITGYPDILETAAQRFQRDVWSILFYDPATSNWEQKLTNFAKYIAAAREGNEKKGGITELTWESLQRYLNLN